jgi:hypothetical protein
MATNGKGSARVWLPCTPAMATGLTDHVWSLNKVLRSWVPPWPQPQTVEEVVPVDDQGGEQLTCAQLEAQCLGRGIANLLRVLITGSLA